MKFSTLPFLLSLLLSGIHAHQGHGKKPQEKPQEFDPEYIETLNYKWNFDYAFSGIMTFAHLPHTKCLINPGESYDFAIVGVPFDTAVSYRPGARFGPRAIRHASQRQLHFRGFNAQQGINPYMGWAQILDCGDIPVSPFDNDLALRQMTEAFTELLTRRTYNSIYEANTQFAVPRLVSLGGDHSIALASLRALNKVYGRISVLHFDAHLDTWLPNKYPSNWFSLQHQFTHGTMFALAHNESLLLPSVHAGLRTRLSGLDFGDYYDDDAQGWHRIEADEIDDVGPQGVVDRILKHLPKGAPVYISVDIDVLDPGLAPGTGTPEPGGWTSRELVRILRKVLPELNVVGVDVVEVAPAYDDNAESTALAAAQVVFEILSGMVKKGVAGGSKPTVAEGKKAVVKDEL